jgi:hypothetical protein
VTKYGFDDPRDGIGTLKTPYTCKFCQKPINFLNRVALNPDGSKHFCRNAAQDAEEIDYRDDIARLVLESELKKVPYGEGLDPHIPDYCFEVAEWMLAARRNMKPKD